MHAVYPHSVVLDGYPVFPVIFLQEPYRYLRALGVENRVLQEIAEDGVEEGMIAHNLLSLREIVDYLHCSPVLRAYLGHGAVLAVELAGDRLHVGDSLRHHVREGDTLLLDLVSGLVHAGDGREVEQETGEPLGLLVALAEEDVPLLGTHIRVVDEGFQVAVDTADGGLELVADVLGELLFLTDIVLGLAGHHLAGGGEGIAVVHVAAVGIHQAVEQTAVPAFGKGRERVVERVALLGHVDELLESGEQFLPMYYLLEHNFHTLYTSKP